MWITVAAALAAYLLGTAQGVLLIIYWRRWEAKHEEEAPSLAALQRQVRLLQGRLNTLAPPRIGTGNHPADSTFVDPGASQGHENLARPMSRAELHRQALQRGR